MNTTRTKQVQVGEKKKKQFWKRRRRGNTEGKEEGKGWLEVVVLRVDGRYQKQLCCCFCCCCYGVLIAYIFGTAGKNRFVWCYG